MGRYRGPKNKIARRFGVNLGLKINPAKVARRLSQPPGAHGQKKRPGAVSNFGKQLLEKQKAKYIYGLREKQLRRYMQIARRKAGDSGVTLLEMLEMRFDNVVFRLGFATTRAQARQMVNHGMFLLNGKRMDIPSHIVAVGDAVTIKDTKKKKKLFEGIEAKYPAFQLPSWLSFDAGMLAGKVLHRPAPQDVEQSFDVKKIIEYYSTR